MLGPQRPTVHAEPPPSFRGRSSSGLLSRADGGVPLSPVRPPASFTRSASMRSVETVPSPKRPVSAHSSRQSSSDSLSSTTTASSFPSSPRDPEEQDLIQVVYTSSAYSRHISVDEIRDILAKSRINNASKNVTGLLLYRDGSFVQFLEGPATVVDSLYITIEGDPRHRGIIRVMRQSVEKRDFREWNMAFRDLDMLKKQMSGQSRNDNDNVDRDVENVHDGFSQLLNVGLKVGDQSDSEYRPDAFGNAKLNLPVDMSGSMKKLITTFYRLLDRPL